MRVARQAEVAARAGAVEGAVAPLRVAVVAAEAERVVAADISVKVLEMVVM